MIWLALASRNTEAVLSSKAMCSVWDLGLKLGRPARLLTLLGLADSADHDNVSHGVVFSSLASKLGMTEKYLMPHIKWLVQHGLIQEPMPAVDGSVIITLTIPGIPS